MADSVVAAVLRSGARRRPWGIVAAALGAWLVVALTPLTDGLARALHDVQLRLLAPLQMPAEVVVFDIDDPSLAVLKPHLGTWPYKRDVYALAIEQLRELGARAIAIDLLLADAGPGDEALARAIARPGAPVVLAAAGMRHASDSGLTRGRPEFLGATADASTALPAFAWPTIALPTPSVWPDRAAPALGIITTPLDDDGVLRGMPLWHHDGGVRLPAMPWAVRKVLGDGTGDGAALPPLDGQGVFRFAMPARPAWPEVRPFSDLGLAALELRDAAALRASVQGRVVFIGSSALLADAVMTPQGQVAGTVVLAQAYTALRPGAWVRPPAAALDAAFGGLALLPALLAVWRGRTKPRADAWAAGLVLLVLAGLASWVLLQGQQPVAWVPPLAVLATGLSMSLLGHQRGQRALRRHLRHELAVSRDSARAKSAFLANVSHEIRTPLNALLGVADLLVQSPLTPQQAQHVRVFQDAGHALHALINDLLDLTRIEAGHFELQPAPFDLQAMLQHVVSLMRPRAQARGLELRLELTGGLPEGVHGDRVRVEQGLINLVGNAVKFTSRGEVCVRVRREAEGGAVLRFDVADTGIGIAASKLETIFEPFEQADGSVTRTYGGTGLGLAITRQVAQLMGGTVQVQSTPGTGSTFTLRLPLPAAPLPAAAVPRPAPAALHGGAQPLSVLLAEDNEVNVYLFTAMLQAEPLVLQVAPNGPAALDMLRRRPFDIAFMDVQMPGMDGLSVTRELRALEAAGGRRRTPVVALTANAFASDVQDSLAAGCDRHMNKPFAREQLIEAIVQLTRGIEPAAQDAEPRAAAAGSAAPGSAAGIAWPQIDRDGALQRLGGDAGLYTRLREHAAVFMAGWAQAFARARQEGNRERALRLAHDLTAIAATVGADELADRASALERALHDPIGPESPDAATVQRTLAALNAVVAVLTAPPDAPANLPM